ncbi:DNA-binding protein [Variovorax boronicumulans]|uniref:DNA-binding protein n=1 Tax=Variovorax boronicumulans TaxID=436515 RepID=UPI0027D859A7|nr:DNA-binding protein [Variovorax boronicumulans]
MNESRVPPCEASALDEGSVALQHLGAGDPLRTLDQAKADFVRAGISVAEWARDRGFSESLVRSILAGRRKCLRGQSHAIAVALGVKRGGCTAP